MDLKPSFKHEKLSLVTLQANGIRSTKEIEEAILEESFWEEVEKDEFGRPVFIATGFSKNMNPIVVAFIIEFDVPTIITLDAKRASIGDIKEHFCKECK